MPVAVRRHCRDLVFENVGFAYTPGNPVLEEVNLRIGFGETIAIVGPNGCGKSTLANLILRFADPTTGVVKLDGVPLPDMRLRDLRRQIGLVTQETMLFDDTIFNNIRYGSPDASLSEVIEAAKRAHAHRFIEHDLPDGYETSAGAWATGFPAGSGSGSPWPGPSSATRPMLILDEATSQVDLESEQAIQQVLEKFTQGRTTVLITHRLAVLSLADRIVVMQGGRMLDIGRHDELLARCGLLPPAIPDPLRGSAADGVKGRAELQNRRLCGKPARTAADLVGRRPCRPSLCNTYPHKDGSPGLPAAMNGRTTRRASPRLSKFVGRPNRLLPPPSPCRLRRKSLR